MLWRRRIAMAAVLVTMIAGIGYGFWPKRPLVDVAQVVRAPLRVSVEEEGRTRVIDRFVISAPVAGYARRNELRVGDAVARDQVIAELEPLRSNILDPRARAQAQARVAAAEATLQAAEQRAAAAQADAELAQTDARRLVNLCKVQCASEQERHRAESRAREAQANLRSARFSVETARYELEAARTALQYSAAQGTPQASETVRVRAPINGRVLKLNRESEGVVEAGQALIEVGDPRALEVEVDLLSSDAVRVRPGTRVLFDRWGGEQPLEGVVRTVEPVGFTKISALGVEEQRVWVIADLTSPAELWQRLGDGYRVEARFIVWEGDHVLQIPASALFHYGDGWAVFVVQDGRAVRRPIRLGHRNDLSAEVVSGLKQGEEVITHPDDALEDGAAVQIRSASASMAPPALAQP